MVLYCSLEAHFSRAVTMPMCASVRMSLRQHVIEVSSLEGTMYHWVTAANLHFLFYIGITGFLK